MILLLFVQIIACQIVFIVASMLITLTNGSSFSITTVSDINFPFYDWNSIETQSRFYSGSFKSVHLFHYYNCLQRIIHSKRFRCIANNKNLKTQCARPEFLRAEKVFVCTQNTKYPTQCQCKNKEIRTTLVNIMQHYYFNVMNAERNI